MSTVTSQLHQYLIAAIEEIRNRFALEDIGHFTLNIECSGRTIGFEAPRIEYKLAEHYPGGNGGARLAPTIDEAIHRHQWVKHNSPQALPKP